MKINIKRLFKIVRFGTYFYFFFYIAVSSSCRKFVQIPTPNTQQVTASIFNNDLAATSAVLGIYTQMYNNQESFYISANNGSLADELTSYLPGDIYYHNFTNAPVSTPYGSWVNAYSYIYQANAIIAGLEQYSGTSAAVKKQLLGEAYFIRAFWHFYLTNCYGAVPIALTTDFTVTSQLSRTPRVQVLNQVIADLKIALPLLNKNYVDASDTAITNERVTPNQSVAHALLARAYLYLGDYDDKNSTNSDYQQAKMQADSVLSNSNYSLCTNLSGANSVFLANSTEAIWQLYTPQPSSDDTPEGLYYILLAAPSSGNYAVSSQLLNAFEPGDKRQTNWIGTISAGGTIYYFPFKFKQNTYTGTEYTMVLRLAEQYLIRAEAKAELGDPSAVNDLNVIRSRAGLPNYAGAMDKVSLLDAIQHERQVELFTEWGHRWFDLNRSVQNNPTGVNANTVLGVPGNVCQFKGGKWSPDDHQELYPIPQTDIAKDHKLTQNPGY